MTKTSIDSDAIRQLATLLGETGLNEIEYETESLRIRVAKGAPVAHVAAAPAAVAAAPAVAAPAAPADAAKHPGAVKAPMVGVVYMSPEPGAAAFITVGATVAEGQTLLLIEAMKTFNPVKAPRSGKIAAILVDDSQPVEYGEPMVVIE
ncbi:acetyl-CoA carboxylase biotin carboxyl carrier protein [Novispirillum itersonii]|uniref:acetyl-CoA carboxylase biotin carboxyl carrier protein n=1 Tax=Novispirillum itersonii TaxID=189 RepID=UPI00037861CE|nr:acetyl-CoA carboxylase biotin carboxyl carrier protein subunit [Novispirillum itersonii]